MRSWISPATTLGVVTMIVQLVIAVLTLVVFAGAYALRRCSSRLSSSGHRLRQIHEYKPAIVIELFYRNQTGVETQRRVAVLRRSATIADGCSCSASQGDDGLRLFRVDRLVQVATPDGEVLDMQEFLTDWLGVPPKMRW